MTTTSNKATAEKTFDAFRKWTHIFWESDGPSPNRFLTDEAMAQVERLHAEEGVVRGVVIPGVPLPNGAMNCRAFPNYDGWWQIAISYSPRIYAVMSCDETKVESDLEDIEPFRALITQVTKAARPLIWRDTL